MAPNAPITPLSPSELAYLTTSLTLTPPIRPDSRIPTQFRPLVAELDILPFCNGSARMVWADGAECVTGIKVEVARTEDIYGVPTEVAEEFELGAAGGGDTTTRCIVNRRSWVEVGVDVQGLRDDDALNVFLAGMVQEGLFAGDERGLTSRLKINDKFHWKLYIDILLITPPPTSPSLSTTHPLTLLSLTTHLSLRSTFLPLPISQGNEDPLFSDDWDLATPLYPPEITSLLPPISLLVMTIGPNVLLDPSRDELSVAEGVWAVSLLPPVEDKTRPRIVGVRTLETIPVPIEDKTVGARGGGGWEGGVVGGRGGVSRETVRKVIKIVGAVAGEVWEALDGVVKAEKEKQRE